MRSNLYKILAAGFMLALTFIFSACPQEGSDGDSSSSGGGGNEQTYNYCITAYGCLPGPFTVSACSGQVANSCPNSGGTVSSSSDVVSSSSVGNTPVTYSLDGTWERSDGLRRFTVSGTTAILNYFASSPLSDDAANKGYIAVGSLYWRNLTSTGNLTWSGEVLVIWYNTSNPNVATGTTWENRTITMSADGQTINVSDNGGTWTRKQ